MEVAALDEGLMEDRGGEVLAVDCVFDGGLGIGHGVHVYLD